MLAGRDLPADILELHPSVLAITGTGLLVAGGLLRLWVAGYIRKNQEVTRAGPYSLVRHPLYLGTLLAWLGFLFPALANTSWLTVAFGDMVSGIR